MKTVDCPHCDGMGGHIDWSRCGKNCRSVDPPMNVCPLCNGKTVVTQDVFDDYEESGDCDY